MDVKKIHAVIVKHYLHPLSGIHIKNAAEKMSVFWQDELNCRKRKWMKIWIIGEIKN